MFKSNSIRLGILLVLALLIRSKADAAEPPVSLEFQRSIEHGLWFVKVAVSPDSKLLVVAGSYDGKYKGEDRALSSIQLWSLETGKVQGKIRWDRKKEGIEAVCFAPSGKLLGTATSGGVIDLWDVNTGKRVQALSVSKQARTLHFSPDGKVLVAGDSAGELVIWETQKWSIQERVSVPLGKQADTWVGGYSPDGNRFAIVLDDATVHVWESPRWKLMHSINAAIQAPDIKFNLFNVDLAFTPDSKALAVVVRQVHRLLTIEDDQGRPIPIPARGTILFDVEKGTEIKRFGYHLTGAHSVAFSRDSRWGFSCGLQQLSPDKGEIAITDLKTDKVADNVPCFIEAAPGKIFVSPDGKTLVVTRINSSSKAGPPCVSVWKLAVQK